MPIVPLFGTSTFGKSSNVTAQRRINLYAERFGEADKSPMVFYGRPGLVKRFTNDTSTGYESGGPIRGLLTNRGFVSGAADRVYAAQGTHLMLSTDASTLAPSPPGYFLSSAGVVQMASLGDQVLAVDGVTGYRLDTGTNLSATTFPAGATSCCAVAGRFVTNDPSIPGRFRWSGVYDITDWDPLNFATAESASDPLPEVFERGGELLLFGGRTLEFWQATGGSEIFARVGGAGIDWGLAVFDTVRKANDSVLFLGSNLGGEPQVCMLRGYQVQVVSTPDIEKDINEAIERGVTPETVVHTVAGHTWYIVNIDSTSYAYDTTTGIWDEWQTSGARYCGQYAAPYANTAIVTDYRNGSVYVLDADVQTDGDEPMMREIISRHVFLDLDVSGVGKMQLDVETGVGLISGQGANPQVMMQISKDAGHTFGNEMWRTIGARGKYLTQVTWNRLGIARDWLFKLRITDPVKVALINAALDVSKE